MSVIPRQLVSIEGMPEAEHPHKEIVIYICPTADCPGYYAAPDFRPDRSNLSEMQYHRRSGDGKIEASHPRIQCPYCRDNGMKVDRVPYVVTEVVSLNRVAKALKKAAKKEAKAAKKVAKKGGDDGIATS